MVCVPFEAADIFSALLIGGTVTLTTFAVAEATDATFDDARIVMLPDVPLPND
jgi:hypothetical protein